MRNHPDAVALHPYFKCRPGQIDAVKASLNAFVEAAAREPDCLFYGFTMRGDELFCQEAYTNAGGALAHIDNIGPLLGELLKLADLVRLEIHGPADQLARLREPLASFNPAWFVYECGLD